MPQRSFEIIGRCFFDVSCLHHQMKSSSFSVRFTFERLDVFRSRALILLSPSKDTTHPYSNYKKITDTTLRDGEQSPGATLNRSEKLQIASSLSAMGVDVCEAGFPIASPGDFDAVHQIVRRVSLHISLSKLKNEFEYRPQRSDRSPRIVWTDPR